MRGPPPPASACGSGWSPSPFRGGRQRIGEPGYDPPSALTGVSVRSSFAFAGDLPVGPAGPDCASAGERDYFAAADIDAATTASRAFRLFRQAVAEGDRTLLSCRRQSGGDSCAGAMERIASVTRFLSVESIDRRDGENVVLRLDETTELRLTVGYPAGPAGELTRARLVMLVPEPPI